MKNIYFLILSIVFNVSIFCSPSISFSIPGTNPLKTLNSDVQNGKTNYYIVAFTKDASNNDIATGNKFTIDVTGLGFTSNTNVIVVIHGSEASINLINANPQTTTAGDLHVTYNSSTLTFGVYNIADYTGEYVVDIWTSGASPTLIVSFTTTFLIIEKTKQVNIPSCSYNFLIHYVDKYFSGRKTQINTYLDEVTNALDASWSKEIISWSLCNGIRKSYPSKTIYDQPLNEPDFYDIILVCSNSSIPATYYHQGNQFAIYSYYQDDDIRKIFLDCDIKKKIGTGGENVLNEQELIYSILSHEFYHGIQFSIMPYSKITPPTGLTRDQEFVRRFWLIEGQAKFLESVFMKDYSRAGTANILYSVGTNSESYGQKCADFITHAIDQNYAYKNMHDISYEFALFWRNIYEHFYSSGTTDKDRLDILRQTCISYNTENSSEYGSILNIISNKITNKSYSFKEFIEDLATRVYFRDAVYKYWDDPNGNNFYSAITTAINENTTTWTTDAEFPASGTTWNIPNILSFRTHKFKIQTPGTYTVAFKYLSANYNQLSAKVYVFDNTKIYSSYDINFYGSQHYVCVNVPSTPAGPKNMVVIVTWSGNGTNFNYNIAITKTAPVSNYTMSVDATQPPFTVKFANNPPFPYAQFLEWDFGESTSMPWTIIAVSPTHLYSPGKYYTLTQSTRNCNGYIVDTKNAGIAFVPYIQDLSVTNQSTNAAYAQYTRTVSGSNLVFNKLGNYLIPASQKILIKANVYGYVDYLKLTVLDNSGNTVLTSDGVFNTTDNTYHFNLISQQLRTGVNKLKFTGHFTINSTDYPIPAGTDPLASERVGHDIYNRTDNLSLSSYPAKLNTWNITNWAAYTGPDDNYSITVEAPPLSDQYMEILINDNCYEKATFYIHSVPDGSILDFGDKTAKVTVSPNTIVTHTFNGVAGATDKFVVKLSDPSGQLIMTRLVCFPYN